MRVAKELMLSGRLTRKGGGKAKVIFGRMTYLAEL
jgi:hypothetical protein